MLLKEKCPVPSITHLFSTLEFEKKTETKNAEKNMKFTQFLVLKVLHKHAGQETYFKNIFN